MTLAEKITALRGERKLSQGDVAEKLDVSRQSVSKWETGQAVPELDKIIKLADLFGVSVDELVRDGEAPAPEAPPAQPARETKIVYMERKGLSTVQIVGAVALVVGALMLFLGRLSAYAPMAGIAAVILSLPLLLAKKHPFLIAGWLLCLGSCVVLNPYTSVTPWGLWGGIRALRVYTALNDFTVPGYRSYLFGIGIAVARGVLALVLLFFTARACLRRWKGRGRRQTAADGQPETK